MLAAADDEVHGRLPALAVRRELIEGAAQERVVPLADQQDGHVGGVREVLRDAVAHLLPVLVVQLVVLPVLVPVVVAGRQRERREALRQGREPHQPQRVLDLAVLLQRRLHRGIRRGLLAFGRQPEHVVDVVRQQEGPAPPGAVLVVVARPDADGGRHQARRVLHQDGLRGRREIGRARGDDPPVRPGLLADPLDRVEPVRTLLRIGGENALRVELAAHVLHDHHVAVARVVVAVRCIGIEAVLAVRRPLDDRGPGAGQRHAVPGRQVQVRRQPDPVAHRHHHVADDGDPVLRLVGIARGIGPAARRLLARQRPGRHSQQGDQQTQLRKSLRNCRHLSSSSSALAPARVLYMA